MLITRYISKNLGIATAFVGVSLTAAIWLNLLLGRLGLYISSAAPFSSLLKLVLLSTPQFIEVMLPLALVIAILFTYNRLAADSELAVMRSSGMSQMSLARPAFAFGVAAAFASLWLSAWVTPASFYEMHALRQTLARDYSAALLREGVFNSFGDALTIYIRSRNAAGEIGGLLIYDRREDKKRPVTVTAKRGLVRMNGDAPSILLYDGVREQASGAGDSIDRLKFAQYAFDVSPPPGPSRPAPTMDESTLGQLLDARSVDDGARIAEINRRLVVPFSAIGFALVAAAMILLARPGRTGHHHSVIAAAVVVSALEAADLSLAHAVRSHPGLLPVLYLAVLLPALAAGFSLHWKGEKLLSDLRRALQARDDVRMVLA
jgi:lipopolysaccharide export system permease protein